MPFRTTIPCHPPCARFVNAFIVTIWLPFGMQSSRMRPARESQPWSGAKKKERKHRQPKYTQTVISANGIKQCRTEKIILSQLSLFCSLPSKLASSFNLHEEGREYGRFLFVISQFLKSSCQIKRCTAASWWCGPWAKGQFHSLGGFAYRPEITDGHGYMFRVWPAPVTLHYGAPAGAYDRPTPRGTSENNARKGKR